MDAQLHSVPPTLQQATTDPRRLLDTHRHVWVSLLWGHCLFLLSAGAHKILFVPSKSVSPVLYKFWQFYSGVNGNLPEEGLCHTQVCCMQIPCPCGRPLLTHTSTEHTQTQFWHSLCGLGMYFVLFPGLSSSGNQVVDECIVPGGPCILITSLVPATRFAGCAARALSQVCCMIAGCNPPGGCQLPRILGRCGQQLGACSQFGGIRCLWGQDWSSSLHSSSGCRKPASASKWGGAGTQPASSPLVFARSFVLWVGRLSVRLLCQSLWLESSLFHSWGQGGIPPHTPLWEGFLLCGNFSSFTAPSLGQVSVLNSFVSFFVFYILSYLLQKRMGCLSGCLVSSASVQKLFCGS